LLFDLTTAYLVERKILLPGISVLERVVASARDRAALHLWKLLASLPSPVQRAELEQLLEVVPPDRQSSLDKLRQAPYQISSKSLVEALGRVETIRKLEVGKLKMERIPPIRLKVLARYVNGVRAQALERLSPDRRIASLLAFAWVALATTQDDSMEVLEQLTTSLLARAESAGLKERLRTLPELDEAALQLKLACEVLLDAEVEAAQVRPTVYLRISAAQLRIAMALVSQLARPNKEDNYYELLLERYKVVRNFLPKLLTTIQFYATEAGKPVLEGLTFLKSMEGKPNPRPKMEDAPSTLVNRAWHSLVYQQQHRPQDRRYYTFCVLERLQEALKKRELFITPSERWGNPRAKLILDENWSTLRPQICRTLSRNIDPKVELTALEGQLNRAYLRTAANLPTNAAIRIEQKAGEDRVVLTPLDKLPESASLVLLKDTVAAMLPKVDLAEVILEIATRTNFTAGFTHLSENQARAEDLALSLCAVLLTEACNIGLEPVVQRSQPALKRDRLGWVQQNYIRADTITRANATLVEAHSLIPLVQSWGGGEVASADGLRFVVPIRTLNARPNSKYFGSERGITYYNFISDQFSGLYALVIPGTLRDSLYLLEGVLGQQTILQPTEFMTDTAGASNVIYGLFWLLGYQFSPRLADLSDARYWRLNYDTNYGALEGVARHKVNTNLITQNWDDILRVAGSLKLGTISPTELMRTLQGGGRASTLGRAIGELGRLCKTLYILTYIDDEGYRRRILIQLNRGESRHTMARAIFHGKRGELRQRYREGQEDQLGALGLVVNMLVLWNTIYMEAALNQIRKDGKIEVKPEDVARLSPLGFEHCNLLGRYHFSVPEYIQQGQLRPLRNPADPND
jgi:TnpA family transposase